MYPTMSKKTLQRHTHFDSKLTYYLQHQHFKNIFLEIAVDHKEFRDVLNKLLVLYLSKRISAVSGQFPSSNGPISDNTLRNLLLDQVGRPHDVGYP